MPFQTYLSEKIQKEDEKEQQMKIKAVEKEQRDQQRWEEKKQLKEKEIDAIVMLAKAIAERK